MRRGGAALYQRFKSLLPAGEDPWKWIGEHATETKQTLPGSNIEYYSEMTTDKINYFIEDALGNKELVRVQPRIKTGLHSQTGSLVSTMEEGKE